MNTTWKVVLSILVFFVAVLGSVGFKVFAHLVSEEVESRLDQIGYAVLRLACRRLPVDLRESYYQEWAAELDAHFLGATERPLTRLYWSLRFPGALLFRARSFARIQDPAAFRALSDHPVVQFVRDDRRFRLFMFGAAGPGLVAWNLWIAFWAPAVPPFFTVILTALAVVVTSITVLGLLTEWTVAIYRRTGSAPSWWPHIDGVARFVLRLDQKGVARMR